MARKTIVQLTDDIDGSAAVETVTFALDGVTYEIDLNQANAEQLRAAINPYATASRRLARATSRGTRAVSQDYDARAVRAWAASKGIDVPTRGRIPKVVVEQYHAAGY